MSNRLTKQMAAKTSAQKDNSLSGKVALVTGASRGAGRAIAVELGKKGATVYVTGRSTAGRPTEGRPGTIDDTAEQVSQAGGHGIALLCDHTDDRAVESMIQVIRQQQGKLDILVNNVWGGNELNIVGAPFWELPLKHWDNMFTAGVRAQMVTHYFAIPLMRQNKSGVIFHTSFWDDDKFIGHFYYDLSKNALNRMAIGLSRELRADNIAVIAVSPGFMRTELVLQQFGTDESRWHEVEQLQHSESPHYVGRAITHLALDEDVMKKSGQIWRVGDLAKEYNFTDVDGRYIPPFRI